VDTLVVALRVVLSLGAVFGLLWYLQRRLIKGGRTKLPANLVTVVGRANVGQKASVVVVNVDGQRLILGVTEHAVTVLHGSQIPIDDAASETHAAAIQAPVEVSATVFARSLHSATGVTVSAASDSTLAPTLAAPRAFRPRRKGGQLPKSAATARLAGSILSPATWTQAAAALRNGR